MDHDNELTPAERLELDALPREREPSRVLEERTVRALRSRGDLVRVRRGTPQWLLPGLAAGLVLFLGGMATGQWLATRQTASALSALQQESALHAAAQVQQAGTAYARSIAMLSELRDSANSEAWRQGREVALSALYHAASEIIRLTPDDPVAVRILQVMDRGATGPDSAASRAEAARRVVWF